MEKVFSIVFIYFLFGAAVIFIINRKLSAKENKDRWIKYLFYLFIVLAIIISILYSFFYWISIIISCIAITEVIDAWKSSGKKKKHVLFSGLIIASLLCILFYGFSQSVIISHQLFVYNLVFAFDGFSQLSGQLFGKTKLIPKVSPNKTVEGVMGGLVTTLLTGMLIMPHVTFSINKYALVVIVCIASLTGDLLASYYKRLCGIKDYSKLIPGHGGILDRFDSFIAAGAVYRLLYHYIK
jgi:phosphatidate cytidylyltransferase